MFDLGTIKLESERLILRRVTEDDVEAFYKNWASDKEVTKFLSWPTHEDLKITKMVLSRWIKSYEDKSFYQWGIEIKETHELIGTISGVDVNKDNGLVELGFCIGRKWWNKGYTTEATKRVIKFFFEDEKINTIIIGHDKNNYASKRVIDKCGFVYDKSFEMANNNDEHALNLYYHLDRK